MSRPAIRSAKPRSRDPADVVAERRALRARYAELRARHVALVRQANHSAAERCAVAVLARFALDAGDAAYATADREHVLVRSRRWYGLERDRTPWRATARDPTAPAEAPTLLHLAVHAAARLLGPGAPTAAFARYERPERGDVFDVRFERLPEQQVVGISVRDVTRLVRAERDLSAARRELELARAGAPGTVDPASRSRAVAPPRS